MSARYCIACGNTLAEGSAFCSKCGRPVHETAQVSTSQTDVQVPPHQQQPTYSQQPSSLGKVRTRYYWITFIVLAILALLIGDNGTVVGLLASVIAALWTYRDACSRAMGHPTAWTVGVFLLWIVFLPIYLFNRRPLA